MPLATGRSLPVAHQRRERLTADSVPGPSRGHEIPTRWRSDRTRHRLRAQRLWQVRRKTRRRAVTLEEAYICSSYAYRKRPDVEAVTGLRRSRIDELERAATSRSVCASRIALQASIETLTYREREAASIVSVRLDSTVIGKSQKAPHFPVADEIADEAER